METFLAAVLKTRLRSVGAVVAILGIVLLTSALLPPFQFKKSTAVSIPSGVSIREAAALLAEEHVIRSPFFFTFLIQTFGGERGVSSGTYHFERAPAVFEVAYRTNRGLTGAPLVKVTLPEGSTSRDIALRIKEVLPEFDADRFRVLARPHEGYLFPETYFFAEGVRPEEVIATMRTEFDQRTALLQEEVASFGRSFDEVVVMASLLEKEARRYETKQVVAGILWKRLEQDIPLQVDAVFGYILDTDTFSPTFAQLEIESPYNTYTNRGLPPGAIANPGIESLRAAVNPTESPYFFYLTGADGTMHYAETFDEHVANRRYLR